MMNRSLRPFAALSGRMAAQQRPVLAFAAHTARLYSSQSPKEKASSLIDSLPGNSALSKSGVLATGLAGGVYLIANSLYVVNAETVLLTCVLSFITIFAKTGAPGYREWADGHINHIKDTLNKARENHVLAVQDRIDNVGKLSDVVDTTKQLFSVSKQTVEVEAKAFELRQKVEFAEKARETLDAWVRHESQIRARQQRELYQSVVEGVEKALSSDKFQKEALNQAVAEIETLFKKK